MFDKTPAASTYQTKTIELVKEINSRGSDTSKDEDYLNVFPELIRNKTTKENSFKLVKRDGCTSFANPGVAASIRGIHYWKDQNKIFVAVEDDIYIYNTSGTLLTTLSAFFGTSSGKVGFCDFLYDTGVVKIVATDGTTLKTIDSSNTIVAGVDADMPTPHLPIPIFLDGYLFLVKTDTADIYNSNLNDPLAYTAGDFISAEMRADQLKHIAVLNNYIVGFGNGSIEYFWDAANASGTPLQRNDTPIKLNGFIGGVAHHGIRAFFIGQTENGQLDIYVLDDFKIQSLSNEAVKRHLASISSTYSTTLTGNIVSLGGHDFYVLYTGSRTYVLELETMLWTRWSFQSGSAFAFTHSINLTSSSFFTSIFALSGASRLYEFRSTLYQDFSTNFPVTIITAKFRFDTLRSKTMSRLIVWANQTTSNDTMSIQWTDDDYQSYNTARTIDLSKERPTINRLGRFRERAFKLTFTANQPLILYGIEVDLNTGQH